MSYLDYKVPDAGPSRRKREVQSIINDYLKTHPCIDCGEDDIIVLEFDHRNPDEKSFTIASATSKRFVTPQIILDEIAKCDVRCANCHRRRTYVQLNYKTRI